MRDRLALLFLRLASSLTTWSFADDHINEAIKHQRWIIRHNKDKK